MLERKPDWTKRLDLYVMERRLRRFEWGANDCVSFAAGAVEATTGADLMPEMLGPRSYKTARGASAVIRRAALGATVDPLRCAVQACLGKHGVRPVRPAFARRGDIGLADGINGETVVVRLATSWVGPGEDCLEQYEDARVKLAWAIGWPGA